MSYEAHNKSAQQIVAHAAVITLSDTRSEPDDTSGAMIRDLLTNAGHQVVFYRIIKDEPAHLRSLLTELLNRDEINLILTNGGTGISPRDQTVSVIEEMLKTPLPGFGELFRMLSWQQIGSGAMLSRALGGIISNKLLFAMPGSPKAVDLALTRLILPELRHLLWTMKSPGGSRAVT